MAGDPLIALRLDEMNVQARDRRCGLRPRAPHRRTPGCRASARCASSPRPTSDADRARRGEHRLRVAPDLDRRRASLVLPIAWLCLLRPHARRICIASSRRAVGTCITTPSSSLKSARSVSSSRRALTCVAQFFESPYSARLSAMPSLSVTSMSTLRLTPTWPANAISQTVAQRPPSLRSWYARTRPASRNRRPRRPAMPARRIVEIRHLVAELAEHLREHRAAHALPAAAEVDQQQRRVARLSCGVERAAHVVERREGGDDEADRRRHLLGLAARASRQRVRIDRLSLPTGTLMPSATHSALVAWTVS